MTNTIDYTKPSDRVQVRTRSNLMPPAHCAMCGFGQGDRQYVDPGIWYDYEGQVYFCNLCTEELGQAIGMLPVGESEHLKALSAKIAEENVELKRELEELRVLRDTLRQFGIDLAANFSTPDSNPEASSDEQGTDGESSELTNESPINGEAEQSKSIESSKSNGQSDVTARTTVSNGSSSKRGTVSRSLV